MRALIHCAALLALTGLAAPAAAESRVWKFDVSLNDTPIGHHRFALSTGPAGREMKIEARFNVKALFISLYRYEHDATERWRGNCLEGLAARTDDDGRKLAVNAALEGERLSVVATGGRAALSGCVMSFAYWNPEILRQSRLLNAQTGEHEAVKIAMVGSETLTVRGAAVPASRYRITGPANPIDLWYSAGGDWLALESTVAGGKRLRYQLVADGPSP